MPPRIDATHSARPGVLRLAGGLAGAALCGGCGSHSAASNPCANADGTYVLAVAPTGQSENLTGSCSASAPAQTVEVSFVDGGVSLNGENCLLCAIGSCQMDVVCGQSVDCTGSVVPVTDPPGTYVQNLSFELPQSDDASTPNAIAEIGPAYCGYSGAASRVPP